LEDRFDDIFMGYDHLLGMSYTFTFVAKALPEQHAALVRLVKARFDDLVMTVEPGDRAGSFSQLLEVLPEQQAVLVALFACRFDDLVVMDSEFPEWSADQFAVVAKLLPEQQAVLVALFARRFDDLIMVIDDPGLRIDTFILVAKLLPKQQAKLFSMLVRRFHDLIMAIDDPLLRHSKYAWLGAALREYPIISFAFENRLLNMVRRISAAEIRKNFWLLAQGSRQGLSPIRRLPSNFLREISALTGDGHNVDEPTASAIANSASLRPE
jgi:hypothetical protein